MGARPYLLVEHLTERQAAKTSKISRQSAAVRKVLDRFSPDFASMVNPSEAAAMYQTTGLSDKKITCTRQSTNNVLSKRASQRQAHECVDIIRKR